MSLRTRFRRALRAHAEAASETYFFLARRSISSLLVWLMIGLSLALPSGLYLLGVNLARVESNWTARPALNVYLDVGLAAPVVTRLRMQIAALPGVVAVEHVTAERALAELARQLPIESELRELGGNPLPDSFRVAAAPSIDLTALEAQIRRTSGVDQVVSERLWRERFAALTGLVIQMGWLLGSMLALTSSVVAGAAVRLAVDARLDEIQVLRLFGATDAQVRRPFLDLGLWYGLGGGLLGALAVSVSLGVVERALAPLSLSYGAKFDIAGFDLQLLVTLIGGGAVLGVLGAWVSAQWRATRAEFA